VEVTNVTINNRDKQVEIKHARACDAAAEKLSKDLAALANWPAPTSWQADPLGVVASRYEQVRATVRALARGMLQEQERLADKLVSDYAKEYLFDGNGAKALGAILQNVSPPGSGFSMTSLYPLVSKLFEYHKKHPEEGGLGAVWRKQYGLLHSRLGNKSSPGYDPKLDAEFTKAFGGDTGIAYNLDRWGARKSEDIFKLAWELSMRLREARAKAEEVFRDVPDVGDCVVYTLDAITVELGKDVRGLTGGN
jgi:hypothetical protein